MAQAFERNRNSDVGAVRDTESALSDHAEDLRRSIFESLALLQRSRELLDEPVFGILGSIAPRRRRRAVKSFS